MTTFSQTSGVCENNTKLTVIYFKKARESNTRPKLSEIIPWHMPLSCCSGCSEFSLKKVHDLFLFFFAVHIFPHTFLECHSSPCYKSEICLHIFWDFFFFLINCVLFEGRNLHIFLLGASWFCSALHCSAQALVEAFQEAALRALLSLLLGCEHWVGVP